MVEIWLLYNNGGIDARRVDGGRFALLPSVYGIGSPDDPDTWRQVFARLWHFYAAPTVTRIIRMGDRI